MASTYLTNTGSGSGFTTGTLSGWIKRSKLQASNPQTIWGYQDGTSTNSRFLPHFDNNSDKFIIYAQPSSGSGTEIILTTNREFRDVSAWYHIVIAFNTTQATASDRVKLYINGVQETSFSSSTYPSQNYVIKFMSSTSTSFIGNGGGGSNNYYFDGQMAHVHFVDGTAYDSDTFGETDSTTGIWKPKTAPSVTYGTNGFFLKFENSGAFGTDSSGNSNTFTVNGTMTQTIDTPSNVFATFNPLISQTAGVAGRNDPIDAKFFNGNTTIATSVAYWTPQLGNMEISSGKYYWEQKFEVDGTPSNYLSYIGIEATDTAGTNLGSPSGRNTDAIAYGSGGDVNKSNGNIATYDTWTAGDIVMCAVDLDNNYIYFGKNGTWQNSGDPTSGSSGTGGIAVTAGKSYITAGTIHRGGNYTINTTYSYAKCNFGNGYFGTTAVSSAQNPDDGIGIFEYDVPAGYRALCTKSINAEEYS